MHNARRSPQAHCDAAGEIFQARTVARLLEAGAVLLERRNTAAELLLHTPIGKLRVAVFTDWIASQFDDVAAGFIFSQRHTHWLSNKFSGKWNWSFTGRQNVETIRCEIDAMYYVRMVEKLLRYNPLTGKIEEPDAEETTQASGAGPLGGVRGGEDSPPVDEAEYIDE